MSTGLSLGVISTFLIVVVVLPLAALLWESKKSGAHGFWQIVSSPETVAALKLTFGAALIVALINAVLGTITAWVLVRDDFRGKALVNAIIDLPFALPTIVAGLTLLALYGPRSPVQPVLLELDVEMEDAARSLGASRLAVFRRIVLPNLLPGILSGVVLALARALGEIGSIVVISGNIPYHTEVASVFIFNQIQNGYPDYAAAVAVILLAAAFVLLLAVGALRFFATRHERA